MLFLQHFTNSDDQFVILAGTETDRAYYSALVEKGFGFYIEHVAGGRTYYLWLGRYVNGEFRREGMTSCADTTKEALAKAAHDLIEIGVTIAEYEYLLSEYE